MQRTHKGTSAATERGCAASQPPPLPAGGVGVGSGPSAASSPPHQGLLQAASGPTAQHAAATCSKETGYLQLKPGWIELQAPAGPEAGQVSPQPGAPSGNRAHSQHPRLSLPWLHTRAGLPTPGGHKEHILLSFGLPHGLRQPQGQHTETTARNSPTNACVRRGVAAAPTNTPQEAPPIPAAGPVPQPRGSSGFGSAPFRLCPFKAPEAQRRERRRWAGPGGGGSAGPGALPGLGPLSGRWLRCWVRLGAWETGLSPQAGWLAGWQGGRWGWAWRGGLWRAGWGSQAVWTCSFLIFSAVKDAHCGPLASR